ncbi:hypothetical protein [Nocardioides acrostichi]|uniref:Uncharacterized protein n=1 Tax=Nocardioides acrostichi TaxID=2784339 RepID=A0A930V1T7_9ACTN|nr:hypothetical protein [Nocardioides acrostichi]MBF4162479.1 hypothetical protein [Nocardioides acrostichi]
MAGCLSLAACSGGAPADEREDASATTRVARGLSDCDRVRAGRGTSPRYLRGTHPTRLSISDAVCDALWAPHLRDGFVPQGVAVRGHTGWIGGYEPGDGGKLYCYVVRVDLRSAEAERSRWKISGTVGTGPVVPCRHGGGLAIDDHGLWLTESERLWLLDPRSLATVRVWRLADPVQGSFGVLDGTTTRAARRIGLGRFRPSRVHPGRAALDWYELDTVLTPGVVQLDESNRGSTRRIPYHAQGAVWARIGGRTGLWLSLSNTRCGVLAASDGGRGGRRLAWPPGAEGMAASPRGIWVASESGTRHYQGLGGRPVVPSLSLLDVSRAGRWPAPVCEP